MALKINYRLQNGKYVIKKILKQDIFGITYLVYDVKMEKDVILKEFLPPHLARRSSNGRELLSLDGKERDFIEDKKVLRKKIKTLSKLKHTSLLKIYNIFEENNTIYYVTEYVNGTILWNHIENNPMSQADILEMVSYIASAVETIHEKKLLHGNLTPCNIILTSENKPIIIDFIFLRYGFHEYENSSYEKFDYSCFLPSEQFSDKSSKDSYTDIYTLASTIYMMAIGKEPLKLRDRSGGEKLLDMGDLYTDNFKDAIYHAMELSVRDRTQTTKEFTKALFKDKIIKEPLVEKNINIEVIDEETKLNQSTQEKIEKEAQIKIEDNKIAEFYFNRGNADLNQKDYILAIENYTKSIEFDSNYANAYYARGLAYGNLKDYISAKKDYDKAIELDSNFAEAHKNRELASEKLKDSDSTAKDDKKNQIERIIKAKDLKEKEEQVEIKEDKQPLKANIKDAEAHNKRGIADIKKMNYLSAIENFTKAIESNPNFAEAYIYRGDSYLDLKNYSSAKKDYDKAIELNPNSALAYNNRGISHYEVGDYSSAKKDYDKAIELNPNFAEAHNNREKIVQIFSHRKASSNELIYVFLISLMIMFIFLILSMNDRENNDPIETYLKECNNGVMNSCNSLGFLYYEGNEVSKDNAKAVELYQKACNGGSSAGCYNLGYMYENGDGVMQDYSEAVELYQKACNAGNALGCSNLKKLQDKMAIINANLTENEPIIIDENLTNEENTTSILTQENIDSFLRNYLETNCFSSVNDVNIFFSNKIDKYFNFKNPSHTNIYNENLSYCKRWKTMNYQLNTFEIIDDNNTNNEKKIIANISYHLTTDTRDIHNESIMHITLVNEFGAIKIKSINNIKLQNIKTENGISNYNIKEKAYELMTGQRLQSDSDIHVKKNTKGDIIYCLSDMSVCKTEDEVNGVQNSTYNQNDSMKEKAHQLMTGQKLQNDSDIRVKKNSKGDKIYCLSDMSVCKTEEEVNGY